MNNVVLIRFVIQIYKNVYRDAHKIHSVQINKYVQLMVNVENVQIINNVQIKHNMPVKIIFVISIQGIVKHVVMTHNVETEKFVNNKNVKMVVKLLDATMDNHVMTMVVIVDHVQIQDNVRHNILVKHVIFRIKHVLTAINIWHHVKIIKFAN